jgi:hypothetical protein
MSENWKNDRAEALMLEHELKMMEKSKKEFMEKHYGKIYESPDNGDTIYEQIIDDDISNKQMIKSDDTGSNFKFNVGDKAYKPKGYKFPCTIVSIFKTTNGDVRIVGEMDDNGMLHIFNENQLEHYEND